MTTFLFLSNDEWLSNVSNHFCHDFASDYARVLFVVVKETTNSWQHNSTKIHGRAINNAANNICVSRLRQARMSLFTVQEISLLSQVKSDLSYLL